MIRVEIIRAEISQMRRVGFLGLAWCENKPGLRFEEDSERFETCPAPESMLKWHHSVVVVAAHA
jgi:hypothetical protein